MEEQNVEIIPVNNSISFAESFKRKMKQKEIQVELMTLYNESVSFQEFLYLKAEFHQQRREVMQIVPNN